MNILTINTGSSSVRLAVFGLNGEKPELLYGWHLDPGIQDLEKLPDEVLSMAGNKSLSAVVHRVVHGGNSLVSTCLVDSFVEKEINRLATLAPLHNPVALEWIRMSRKLLGEQVSQIAVFDTAFFHALPEKAKIYGLPKYLTEEYGIRRFGFHGIAHRAMWQYWCEIRPDLKKGGRVITLQLGSGSSVAAIHQGIAQDTSMGFSPMEGLIMSTRCGDIDAGIIGHLLQIGRLAPDEIFTLLNNSSGLLGVSGLSSDMQTLLKSDKPSARLAIDIYCYRIRKYIGAYIAVLGGVDGIIIGGGIGENSAVIRELIMTDMDCFGIKLDDGMNHSLKSSPGHIHKDGSSVPVWVIPVDEARIMAEEAFRHLQNRGHGDN